MNPPPLQQLRDEALTMLVLWAASKEYSPDIEHMLKMFAKTFEIPEQELTNRLIQAADGRLTRPDANASASAEPEAPAAAAAEKEAAATAATAPPLSAAAPAAQATGSSEQQINSEQQPAPAADGQQQPTEPEPMEQ